MNGWLVGWLVGGREGWMDCLIYVANLLSSSDVMHSMPVYLSIDMSAGQRLSAATVGVH